ncbi:MAG: NADH-quinone oxidoreductase subunit NuoH [Acidimicrobiales bacterium]
MIPLGSGDPLFADGVDLAVILIVIGKLLAVFAFLMVGVLFMVWFERKIIADMQNRIGPNRAGPFGLLQALADGTKLFFKEDLLPSRAERRVFHIAPYVSVIPAFASFAIIPLGGEISIAGHKTYLQLADPPIGILFLLAMSSIAVYGVMLAGWSSGSKYPLLASVRASAQMVSYEAAINLAVVSTVLIAGSLSTRDIVNSQDGLFGWNFLQLGVVPFVIFLIAGTAESNRPPFDLVEAEQEIVGGYHTEYSSLRFAIFYLAEYMNVITISAIAITLFLGGPRGPGIPVLPDALDGVVWFLVKLLVFLFGYIWLRATLPRLRYDQLMNLGWKVLIPLALFWLLLIAALRVGRDAGWDSRLEIVMTLGIAVVIGGICWQTLGAALRLGERTAAATRTDEEAIV